MRDKATLEKKEDRLRGAEGGLGGAENGLGSVQPCISRRSEFSYLEVIHTCESRGPEEGPTTWLFADLPCLFAIPPSPLPLPCDFDNDLHDNSVRVFVLRLKSLWC